MIPKYILDELAEEDLPHLLEIRDYLDRLITNREGSPEEGASKAETGERRPGSVTYRQEWVYCGKECKKCPHGPYWYCYWKEDGKTRTKAPQAEKELVAEGDGPIHPVDLPFGGCRGSGTTRGRSS
ncbi:MAG TPA: hypothetical protein PLY09_08635 [Methanothrix sp.]|nr:hypothetical protein [Methanothrix sp.]HPJ84811.1 hypothetical protein [Methanothrix sp.]